MDLQIVETGNGGDLVFENGDISLVSEVYNQPFLAHFGGNKEASTPDYTTDFWGNIFLQGNEQMTSSFERMLNETELSSSGRLKLENTAEEDLEYLNGFADTTSQVSITGVDKIELQETITEGNNKSFSYIWNEAKDEII